MRKVKYTWLAFALMLVNLACSCSSSLNDDGDDEPQVRIVGHIRHMDGICL